MNFFNAQLIKLLLHPVKDGGLGASQSKGQSLTDCFLSLSFMEGDLCLSSFEFVDDLDIFI